jgi:hypothetical protein
LRGHILQAIAGFEDDLRQELSLAGQDAAPVVTASPQAMSRQTVYYYH